MKKNILITGGTGFIGKKLTDLLVQNNYSVSILSRKIKQNTSNVTYFQWGLENNFIEETAILKADYIIHLAGESIAEQRWTAKRKVKILQSREKSISMIYEVLKKHHKKVEAFISASGIGIYGAINGPEICTEETPTVNDFLGITCQKWEAATHSIASLGIRTVQLRTGLVLGKEEGFLKKMAPMFQLNLGAALGDGKQYMPWIHVDDLCRIYLEAILNSEMKGPYNAAINDNTNNTIFSKLLAKQFGYKLWLPNVPAFVLQLILGEMAQLVLTGRRVSSAKIEKLGFRFQFQNLEMALKDCFSV